MATIRRPCFCHISLAGSSEISPSIGAEGMTKLTLGLSVNESIGKGDLPSRSRSHREFTKFAMCHRSSTVVLSAKEGIGVPFKPVENVRKMFRTLYGSCLLPRKFQH